MNLAAILILLALVVLLSFTRDQRPNEVTPHELAERLGKHGWWLIIVIPASLIWAGCLALAWGATAQFALAVEAGKVLFGIAWLVLTCLALHIADLRAEAEPRRVFEMPSGVSA